MIGLLLILFAFLFFNVVFFSYRFLVFLFPVGLMRWLMGRGPSLLFSKLFHFRWDGGWMELLGGQGAYRALDSASLIDVYRSVSLGLVLFLVFSILII